MQVVFLLLFGYTDRMEFGFTAIALEP